MGLREKAKQDKRERIHAAALRLFVERGFHATTVERIARRARVATGTVFLYAPDKGALLAQVFCREVAQVQAQGMASVNPRHGFVKQLLAVFSAFYDFYEREPALSRVFLKELLFSAERAPEIAVATREFIALLAQLAAAAQKRGELVEEVEPLKAASIVFAVYWVCLVAWLGGAIAEKSAALRELESALAVVMNGLAAKPQG